MFVLPVDSCNCPGTVHRDLKLENILVSCNESDPNDRLYVKASDLIHYVFRSFKKWV
jgi:serine/threonine protein kinase